MKCYLLFSLFISSNICALPHRHKKKEARIEIIHPHASDEPDPTAEKVFEYIFGSTPEHNLSRSFAKRLQKMIDEDPSIEATVKFIESSSTESRDSNDNLDLIKKLVLETIQEEVEHNRQEALDATLQLDLKKEEMRKQKYKFYAAVVTAITSIGGAITTIIAYNVS